MKKVILCILFISLFIGLIISGIFYVDIIRTETFTPKINKDVDYIIIKNDLEEYCYVIEDKKVISKTIKSLKHLSNYIFDEIPNETILFVKDGLLINRLPLIDYGNGYPKKAIKLINEIKTPKNKRFLYLFQYDFPLEFLNLKQGISNKYKDLNIIYPHENYDSLHPYIKVTYKENIQNFKGIKEDDVYNDFELGEFTPDRKLLPIKDYLIDEGLLFNYSKVKMSQHSSNGEFFRYIEFYLNNSVRYDVIESFKKMIPSTKGSVYETVKYNEIKNIEFYIVSPKRANNLPTFLKEFKLKTVAK